MIGRRIEYLRLKNGLSKKALAAKIGVMPQVITLYESGSEMPDLKTARLLASVFDMTLGKLMSYVPSKVKIYKQASLSKATRMRIEEYFDKILLLFEILNDVALEDITAMYSLSLEQLVRRALAEEKITKSRAAELLEITRTEDTRRATILRDVR